MSVPDARPTALRELARENGLEVELLPSASGLAAGDRLEEANDAFQAMLARPDPSRFAELAARERTEADLATGGAFGLTDGRSLRRFSRPIRVDGEVAGRRVTYRGI